MQQQHDGDPPSLHHPHPPDLRGRGPPRKQASTASFDDPLVGPALRSIGGGGGGDPHHSHHHGHHGTGGGSRSNQQGQGNHPSSRAMNQGSSWKRSNSRQPTTTRARSASSSNGSHPDVFQPMGPVDPLPITPPLSTVGHFNLDGILMGSAGAGQLSSSLSSTTSSSSTGSFMKHQQQHQRSRSGSSSAQSGHSPSKSAMSSPTLSGTSSTGGTPTGLRRYEVSGGGKGDSEFVEHGDLPIGRKSPRKSPGLLQSLSGSAGWPFPFMGGGTSSNGSGTAGSVAGSPGSSRGREKIVTMDHSERRSRSPSNPAAGRGESEESDATNFSDVTTPPTSSHFQHPARYVPSPPLSNVSSSPSPSSTSNATHYFHYQHHTQSHTHALQQHVTPLQFSSPLQQHQLSLPQIRAQSPSQSITSMSKKPYPPPMPIPVRKTSLLDVTKTPTANGRVGGDRQPPVDISSEEPTSRRRRLSFLSLAKQPLTRFTKRVTPRNTTRRSNLSNQDASSTPHEPHRTHVSADESLLTKLPEAIPPSPFPSLSRDPSLKRTSSTKSKPPIGAGLSMASHHSTSVPLLNDEMESDGLKRDVSLSRHSRPISVSVSVKSLESLGRKRSKTKRILIPSVASFASLLSPVDVDATGVPITNDGGGGKEVGIEDDAGKIDSEVGVGMTGGSLAARKLRARRRSVLIDEHIAALGRFIHEIYAEFKEGVEADEKGEVEGGDMSDGKDDMQDSMRTEASYKTAVSEIDTEKTSPLPNHTNKPDHDPQATIKNHHPTAPPPSTSNENIEEEDDDDEEELDPEEVEEKEAEVDYLSSLFPNWAMGRLLGTGATGMVFEAIHPSTLKPLFAIKKTRVVNTHPWLPMPKLFSTIVKVLRLVDHPNILRYYGVESVDGDMYVFLEHANGGSLNERIYESGGVVDGEVCRGWVRQVLEGLKFLHKHDVVHRDLKPGNLMIKNGLIKIGDFGMFGSPSYMAPEIVTAATEQGKRGGQDIWSLGCCLYEMILSAAPWSQLDNIFALYFHMGTWAKKAEDMHPPVEEEKLDDECGVNGESGIRYRRLVVCKRHGHLYDVEVDVMRGRGTALSEFWCKKREEITLKSDPDASSESRSSSAKDPNMPVPVVESESHTEEETHFLDDTDTIADESYMNLVSMYGTLRTTENPTSGDDKDYQTSLYEDAPEPRPSHTLTDTLTLLQTLSHHAAPTIQKKHRRPSLTMVQPIPQTLASPTTDPGFLDRMKAVEFRSDGGEGMSREEILETAGREDCGLEVGDCLLYSLAVNNPLVMTALESGLFGYDALEFLWNPKYRPTALELLQHPYVSSINYEVP
ncbi:Suppressor of Sensor Kinase (SLN1) [Dinochytrium kinnereticum]|nr:Suppressor of Sensor Kinase (SLN1) [Dinochytrium kinnereticum]